MNAAVFPSGVRAAKQINVEIKERGGNIQRYKTRGSFQFSVFQTRAWYKSVGKDFFPFLRKSNQGRKERGKFCLVFCISSVLELESNSCFLLLVSHPHSMCRRGNGHLSRLSPTRIIYGHWASRAKSTVAGSTIQSR